MSPVQYLNLITEKFGEHIAVDDGEIAVSYSELAVAVHGMSVALANMNPIPGSTVAICANYCHEYMVAVLAAQAANKNVLPLSTHASPDELAEIINTVRPSTIIVDEQGHALIPCDEDFKIHFSQFPGLVFTYRDAEFPTPEAFESFFASKADQSMEQS